MGEIIIQHNENLRNWQSSLNPKKQKKPSRNSERLKLTIELNFI